jgi:hypothetical protein
MQQYYYNFQERPFDRTRATHEDIPFAFECLLLYSTAINHNFYYLCIPGSLYLALPFAQLRWFFLGI